jgi:hypothetical protein
MSSFIIFCTFLVLLQFCKRTRNKAFSEPRNTFLGCVSAKPYQNVWARTYGYFYGRLWIHTTNKNIQYMQPLTGYYQGDTHNQQKYSIDATIDWILTGEFYYSQPTKIFNRCNHWLDTTMQGEFHYTQPTKIFNRCNHWLDIIRGNFTTHNQPKYSIDATKDWILAGGISLQTTNQNIQEMQPLAGYYQGEFHYTTNQPN